MCQYLRFHLCVLYKQAVYLLVSKSHYSCRPSRAQRQGQRQLQTQDVKILRIRNLRHPNTTSAYMARDTR